MLGQTPIESKKLSGVSLFHLRQQHISNSISSARLELKRNVMRHGMEQQGGLQPNRLRRVLPSCMLVACRRSIKWGERKDRTERSWANGQVIMTFRNGKLRNP